MGQIDFLAFLSSGKGNCKEVECPQFLQVKGGKSTSTTVQKIYISTVFYHYFLHSTMIFSHFSPFTMTFTYFISTTFLPSFLHSTCSKRAKFTIYSNHNIGFSKKKEYFIFDLSHILSTISNNPMVPTSGHCFNQELQQLQP